MVTEQNIKTKFITLQLNINTKGVVMKGMTNYTDQHVDGPQKTGIKCLFPCKQIKKFSYSQSGSVHTESLLFYCIAI